MSALLNNKNWEHLSWPEKRDMSDHYSKHFMTITINKETDRFFIAIGKEEEHSFIMFGVYDQNQVRHLLCRVGKDVDEEIEPDANKCLTVAGRIKRFFFSSVKSKLINERTVRNKPGNIPISYQAYESSYKHYLEFIQLLENLQTDTNQFPCYKPISEHADTAVLHKTSRCIYESETNQNYLRAETDELAIDNTCRHTAIKLIEEIQKERISSQVSSHFFIDLPYRTKLDYGMPSTDIPFYVLPASPLAYAELSPEKLKVVKKLYRRMEELVLSETDSLQTVKKFNSLKQLYNHITGPQKEQSLNELLLNIQSWKRENKSTLGALRKTYFWDAFFKRESATMTLVNEIEQDLKRSIR